MAEKPLLGISDELLERIVQTVKETLASTREAVGMSRHQARQIISQLTAKAAEHYRLTYLEEEEREIITERIYQEVYGYGDLTQYLDDPTVTDILVNDYQSVFLVREDGTKVQAPVTFPSPQALKSYVNRILDDVGKEVGPHNPTVTGRLTHRGRIYRIHAMSEPVSFSGVSLAIRKFRDQAISPRQLVEQGSWTEDLAHFYYHMTRARCNHMIAGGTSTGKTSLLNTLLHYYVPSHLRIITIETEVELYIDQTRHPDVCRWEAQEPNFEGKGEIPQWVLLKSALRYAPDIILLGEARGSEIIDVLNAMGTGHPGSMTTVHCEHIGALLPRIDFMATVEQRGVEVSALHLLVANSLDLVTFLRKEDGLRQVESVWEVFHAPQHQDYLSQMSDVVIQDIVGFVPLFVRKGGELKRVHPLSPYRVQKFLRGKDPYTEDKEALQ